jgi:hypothetical protein
MSAKLTRIMYVELKSGFGDNGPAWICRARFTRTGRSLYFHGKRLQAIKGGGISGNFLDPDTGDEYWVSGPNKDGSDRHWAGGGPIVVDDDAAEEYWRDIRCKASASAKPTV